MRLELVDGDESKLIEEPGEDQIREALEQVYAEKLTAVVLIADQEGYQFMQTAKGGKHIEYMPSKEEPLYAVEDVSLEEAIPLFQSYARDDGEWEQAVEWKGVFIQPTMPQFNQKQLGIMLLVVVLCTLLSFGLCRGRVMYDQAFAEIRDAEGEAMLIIMISVGSGLAFLIAQGELGLQLQQGPIPTRLALVWLAGSLLYLVGGLYVIINDYYLLSFLGAFVGVTGIASGVAAFLNLRKAYSFDKASVEVQAEDLAVVYAHNYDTFILPKWVIFYRYDGKHTGLKKIERAWAKRRLSKAIEKGRLQIFVRYLPTEPKVHRVSRVKGARLFGLLFS